MTNLETKLLDEINELKAYIDSQDKLINHYRSTIKRMESAQEPTPPKADASTLTAIHLRKVTNMTWKDIHTTLNLRVSIGTLQARVSDYKRELAHAHKPRTLGKDWFTSALTLKDKGLSNTAISNELGITRSSVACRFVKHYDQLRAAS